MANKLKQWMIGATPSEIRELAEYAGTSVAYLHHIANNYRSGSAGLAGAIAKVAERIRERVGGKRLPKLSRADISPVCAACEYYQKCSGKGGTRE